ncbi:uncharacterized protein C23H3.12c isoform X2 [Gossypium hirsutum]|uniref:Uncharacterized protein C23H3.12c isoform X2 n=1 Tax=Gossypium hirsutum TaxID=3635 RepID=A0ABM3ABK1_GOSHI|nr:uncharacterized protein C23H3.12c-like isoform X2 [Gossypium hirsutum]
MKARLVVFPIKGKIWCFSRSIDQSASAFNSANTPSTVKELWKKISSNSKPLNANAELLVDFISNKLLARVKPSEILLKSISKEVTNVRITYPPSLNSRLVRRRLRHIAMRGTVIHRKYFYGSVTLLPLTTALAVLPLPNIPFFWVLFRTYSHWRALQGSEKLLELVSDYSRAQNPSAEMMEASKELDELLRKGYENGSVNEQAISDICIQFKLNKIDVLKWRDLV